jgi:hypothetical protein
MSEELDYDWLQLIQRPDNDGEPKQIDLDGQPNAIPPDPTPLVEAGPPPVQLGLDVDVPVAIKLPRGQGVAYQATLTGGS